MLFFFSDSQDNLCKTPQMSKQASQKRPFTYGSPSKFSPPHKRKPSHYSPEGRVIQLSGSNFDTSLQQSTSQTREDYSSHIKGSNSSHGGFQPSSNEGEELPVLKSVKKEPVESCPPSNGGHDDMSDLSSRDGLSPHDQVSPQQSIANRPQSLIPLANISKKFGGPSNRHVKQEVQEEEGASMEDKLPSQDSILRSLYDQPIYGLDSSALGNDRSDSPSQLPLSLPSNLQESLDRYPGSSENLVLAGYYDSDNYPRYRQSRKNPSKKSKAKEKTNASLSLTENQTPVSQSQEVRMRTFESGGRLVYACDVCKRELSHLTSYRRHMKLHTMERPHKCPVCGKGFIRKYHCIDHLNKHHKDVEFDAETLTLTGQSRGLYSSPTPSGDNPALSDSYSISPSEYNYTLDQSLESTPDANQSMNVSIDQSASSILSELARSAARKNNQKDESKEPQDLSPYTEKSNASTGEPDGDHVEDKPATAADSETSKENGKSVAEFRDYQSDCSSRKSSITDRKEGYQSNCSSRKSSITSRKEGSPDSISTGSMARKQEVSAGIKAIVAHLKSSSRRKKLSLTDDTEANKIKQVLEESN